MSDKIPSPSAARLTMLLCWIAVVLDGFDLVVLGALIPTLTGGPAPFMSTAEATAVSTLSLVGMTLGAISTGALTARLGRRRVMITTVFSFSLFTLACAFAQNWISLAAFRFLAGMGLGACLPTAMSLVAGAAKGRAGAATTTLMTGYHVGAVSTALLALLLLPEPGWRAMFVAGAVPGFVLTVTLYLWLPQEAPVVPTAATGGRAASAADLLSPERRLQTLAICATSFLGLILVYGLNTWLPQLMIAAGYDLAGGLRLLLLMNAGAIVGLLVSGRIGDRIGLKTATICWFAMGALLLAALSVKMAPWLLNPVVFLTGCIVFSAQVLVYAHTSAAHPEYLRAAALGWAAGIGRIGAIMGPLIGGTLVTFGIGHPWGFYVFAAIGALAAMATLMWRPAPRA
ncbi:MFS transporter [Falsigemmobacter faecalis]|uniref:MFS transporter n=1 Tax=Falsigemmobacter faecalis TaxID=2488730 RepID=UPI0018F3D405|nr:MFS transporter [Falsigemmobacter faecalis]